jgi:hypothetical protein
MSDPSLFEEMLATYPAERRELARAVYHRFAEGDSTQFFSQLFLVLDVYAHYFEQIPVRMISANADSLATMQELREEVSQIAKTIEARDVNITNHAAKTDELCRTTLAKCNETIASVDLTVKNLGEQVDTKAIVKGIQNAVSSGIDLEIITPFLRRTEKLAREVGPTLDQIRESADEIRTLWTKRIWKTAWTASLFWCVGAALIVTTVICLEFVMYYRSNMAEQVGNMAQVMKFNQAAFQKLAIAQVPVQVLPTKSDDNNGLAGFVLVIQGAYAADLRQVDGQNDGCIFFHSSVSPRQIRHLQEDIEDQSPATNNPAK